MEEEERKLNGKKETRGGKGVKSRNRDTRTVKKRKEKNKRWRK